MSEPQFFAFVEGPFFASDLAKIELTDQARDALVFALQDLLIYGDPDTVSHVLSSDSDVRYVRSREFPSLQMAPLYLTFRFEGEGQIELRRVVTEADVRAGLLPEP